MKTDLEIKEDVLAQLAWQPNIDETQISVTVKDGIVTLTGLVDDFSKKGIIDIAVKSIAGVKAIAEDIEVKREYKDQYSDKEIAKAAINALEWNASVPSENIIVEVENGIIHLTGELEWAYQRDFAKRTIEHLIGVKEVVNNIQLKPKSTVVDVKNKIEKAFERSANIDSKDIIVTLDGPTVILSGTVHSIKEKDDAEIAAYKAPGITNVINDLNVEYYPIYM